MGTFAPHILADQLILFQPKGVGGSDNAHNVAPQPPEFSDLLPVLILCISG